MSGIQSSGAGQFTRETPQRFPFNSLLPALAVAVDPAAMCRIFADHVWTGVPHDIRIETCEVTRLRYRAGTRCLLQYAVTLRDARTAAVSRQWLRGRLYSDPARAARLARKVHDAVFIPGLRMVVNRLTSDCKGDSPLRSSWDSAASPPRGLGLFAPS